MKLEEIARKTVELIRESGSEGIRTSVLAKKLGISKRRIYDVKAIMSAANLIESKRDREGTIIYWVDQDNIKRVAHIRSTRIRISTSGRFTSVANKGTEVEIQSTSPDMNVETIEN